MTLENEIDNLFSSLADWPKKWEPKKNDEKLYEIYLLALIVDVFIDERWIPIILDGNENNPPLNFKFRGSPGFLYGNKEYGIIQMYQTTTGKCYEVNLGIQIQGKSKIIHEVDVGVYSYEEADDARCSEYNILAENVPLAIECKYYIGTKLDKSLGRQWLGVSKDIGRNKIRLKGGFVTNSHNIHIKQLLKHHNIDYYETLLPSNTLLVHDFRKKIKKVVRSL
ncbi:hypothetical protein [uncultured Rossellomorea sp.]|uniref:hypothetical protein n=1 Tax=uncultured Rossellomorea sp. TaxID=2837549 RepID=UPI00261ABB86|nr:hypothetical protein [uncultured Rossellomorea sp.]